MWLKVVTGWLQMLQVAVGCCKLQWVVVSWRERLKVVVGCWVLLCDAECGCVLSLDDYWCYKLQWVVTSCTRMLQVVVGCFELLCDAVCCFMTSFDVVCCTVLLVGVSWCGPVLLDDACGCEWLLTLIGIFFLVPMLYVVWCRLWCSDAIFFFATCQYN